MIRFRQKSKSVLVIALCAGLFCTAVPVPAAQNTPKEEIVYVNLDENGTVKEINVVNSFQMEGKGEIVDYGNYTSLRNMNTTDEIHQLGNRITVDAGAGKLYYEGKWKDNTIPWKISIQYQMDGKEYPAKEIAGQSGKLTIKGSIEKNTAYPGDFFEQDALQVILTLDTKSCKKIKAPDATIANVGRDKQITYTVLPGKEMQFEITAEVSDFEMDGISINALPLQLNVEVDDKELVDQMTDLKNAIEALDDGTEQLKNGTSELREETSDMDTEVKKKVDELLESMTGGKTEPEKGSVFLFLKKRYHCPLGLRKPFFSGFFSLFCIF